MRPASQEGPLSCAALPRDSFQSFKRHRSRSRILQTDCSPGIVTVLVKLALTAERGVLRNENFPENRVRFMVERHGEVITERVVITERSSRRGHYGEVITERVVITERSLRKGHHGEVITERSSRRGHHGESEQQVNERQRRGRGQGTPRAPGSTSPRGSFQQSMKGNVEVEVKGPLEPRVVRAPGVVINSQ